MPSKPIPDSTREMRWIAEHQREYVGQWVALDGDRLIAASPNRREVSAAAKADGAYSGLHLRATYFANFTQYPQAQKGFYRSHPSANRYNGNNFPLSETTFRRWKVPAFHYRKLLIAGSFIFILV